MTYSLYGTRLIADDSTLRNFVLSVLSNMDTAVLEEVKSQGFGESSEEYIEAFAEQLHTILEDDIPRTDIDYAELMQRYAAEIGVLLFQMENHGYDLANYPLSFFGEKTASCFNALVKEYAYLLKFGGDPFV